MYRSNWLSFEEWKDQGMPILGTTSTEAVKLYDAALTQYVGWYDDPVMGGIAHTMAKLEQADPNFILGKAFTLSMKLFGFSENYFYNQDLKMEVDGLKRKCEENKDKITVREYKHAQAAIQMSQSNWLGAASIWEEILDEYPTDLHALKMAFYMYQYNGQRKKQFNAVERVYPFFQRNNIVNAAYTDGLYAFVLEETGNYSEAEKYAKMGLMKNGYDGWATHALAHTYLMQKRYGEGQNFMKDTCKLWTTANLLACHNYWHFALFHQSDDKADEAVYLLDNEILPRFRSTQTPY
ncbi:Tetratricopeptide repeat protein 38 [Blomia tropicalis]|nr:Tetratricopeptide repeat protein 38 [Blomia tropicalis]